MELNKEMSKIVGRVTSSPFAKILRERLYDYDGFVKTLGFVSGWKDRVIAAGSLAKMSTPDRKFYEICEKSYSYRNSPGRRNPLNREDEYDFIAQMIIEGTLSDEYQK